MNKLKRGTQIIYVPSHAEGNINHPDCERGFVTLYINIGVVFCRYWSQQLPRELRTKVNSESTRVSDLVVCDTVPQIEVSEALEKWCSE